MRRFVKMTCGLLLLGSCASLGAQQLTDAQRSAIKSACRGDYQKVCASVPPGTKDSLQCLVQHSAEVSVGCREALAPAASSSAAAPAAAGGHSLSAREEVHVLRAKCGADFQKLCSNVQAGGGRGVACLRTHQAELTPDCRSALASIAPH